MDPVQTLVRPLRLVAPAVVEGLIDRPRLDDQLAARPGRRLSLVVGPPGAGKTTAVRAWVERLGPDVAWTWCALDRDDDGPSALVRAVAAAIATVEPDAVALATEELARAEPDVRAAAGALVDDVAFGGHDRLVVVCEDVHLVQDPSAWQHLAWLLDHRPERLHLVLTARADPPLALGRLRLLGEVGELRGADLGFTRDEAASLLRSSLGGTLSETSVGAFYDRTEGWVAGVRLAAVALERGATAHEVLERFASGEGTVGELLMEEVLGRQSADVRDFLLRTSVLRELDPALCDAVTGRTDSARLLRRLAADQVFIRPADDASSRYRSHQLFADLLRAELRVADPAAIAAGLGRASAWCEAHADVATAIDFALEAGDHERAVLLITANRDALYRAGELRRMTAWLASIPDAFVRADPVRGLEHATSLVLIARPEAYHWLKTAAPCLPPGDARSAARAQLLTAVVFGSVGRLDRLYRHWRQGERLLAEHGLTDTFLERARSWESRILALEGAGTRAVACAEAFLRSERDVIDDCVAIGMLASAQLAAGDDERADATAAVALADWHRRGEPELFGMVDALRVRAHGYRCRGRLDEATELLHRAARLCDGQSAHLLVVLTALEQAELDRDRGERALAAEHLAALDVQARAIDVAPVLTERITAHRRALGSAPSLRSPIAALIEPLTERERLVLRQLPTHLTLPQLASVLTVSTNTVKTQVASIYRKLGARSRAEAVERADQLGLLG